MATPNISIKLMIDTEANKVLFAEASKDFVDFLFFLLALPIGTVIKLLTSDSMVGSIGKLFTSFESLNETYLEPSVHKNDLLNPVVFSSADTPLLISKSSIISSRNLYTCSCNRLRCNVYDGASCSDCGQKTNHLLKFVAGSVDKGTTVTTLPNDSMVLQGYVKEKVLYLVSDDLSVTPMSTMSIISMTKACNASKLEERSVNIGTKDAMELLKMSLQSGTVLTDVFLGSKQDPCISGDNRRFQDPTSGVDLTHSRVECSPSRPPSRVEFTPPLTSSGLTRPPKDQTSKKRTRSPSPRQTRSQTVVSRGGGSQDPTSGVELTPSRPPSSGVTMPQKDQTSKKRTRSTHYSTYMKFLRKCSLSLERGIDFPAVDPSIRTEAARRNWLTLADHPSKKINVTMVHAFLDLIHGVTPVPTSVTVRGVTVDFSPSAIMAHFKIPDFPISEHFETVWKLSKPKLRTIKINKAHDFLDKNAPWAFFEFPWDSISPAAKVWKQFVNAHFYPSSSDSSPQSVTEYEALILLAILTKVPIHVGHLIHKSIIEYANQSTDSDMDIPFPNTISDLCNSAGVPRKSTDRIAMANSVIIGPDLPLPNRLATSADITTLGAEIKALRSDFLAGFERLSEKDEDLRACKRCDANNIACGAGFDPNKLPHTTPIPFPPMSGLEEPPSGHGSTVQPMHDSSVMAAAEFPIKDLHA